MKKHLLLMALVTTLFVGGAKAQDAMLGEVRLFAGSFAPRGWAFCDGQILNISEYSALFSIIGTYYGGDGRTTFALPDLRGAVPVGVGLSNGANTLDVGESVKLGRDANGVKGLGMHYIICTSGIFPSRN
ncbi:MAG: tail fiber protein [Chitinophagales bacterium]|nr:tail fiber protein [Chitinophagales bacterium]HPR28805.1 tail fiber protein [Chitinophagales bacterium]HQU38526.1 tail fiber protein [Chitinophagales bacterium]HQU75520.1 tail fiber protein [Chitinophagales bacterium]HRX23330.1 tail fiber protein [Chitinophagales bacterium]